MSFMRDYNSQGSVPHPLPLQLHIGDGEIAVLQLKRTSQHPLWDLSTEVDWKDDLFPVELPNYKNVTLPLSL